jgi:imidazole glycerol-phosphate synthase subunit HisH
MISIVDYRLGNVFAITNLYKRLSIPTKLVSTPEELEGAERIILPGVGAFDWAMRCLTESGMRPALDRLVLEDKVPVLGICVGMHMMAKRSEEGSLEGLGWLDAEVKKFDPQAGESARRLPHMGWNDVRAAHGDGLFSELDTDAKFYFLHSYYMAVGTEDQVLGHADYQGQFTCSVSHENVYGVQFHPEKSHRWGVQLLKNFAEHC